MQVRKCLPTNSATNLEKQVSKHLQLVYAEPTLSKLGSSSKFSITDRSDHWLAITTIGTSHPEVLVYDSLSSTVPEKVKLQISSLLCTRKRSVRLQFVDIVKQSGLNDCGVFAVAYATTLCLGKSPGKYTFDQTKMRKHLQRCLEKRHFTMFPITKERRYTGNKIKGEISIPVYCSCRMPAMNPMIECCSCHEWFHVGPASQYQQRK